jgi:hypothetical protein
MDRKRKEKSKVSGGEGSTTAADKDGAWEDFWALHALEALVAGIFEHAHKFLSHTMYIKCSKVLSSLTLTHSSTHTHTHTHTHTFQHSKLARRGSTACVSIQVPMKDKAASQ